MDFSKIDGYAFEDFMAKFFTDQGYKVEPTAYSNDGGVDLIISCDEPIRKLKCYVQCKNWEAPVGVREVRELYGVVVSENINKGILVTTGKYTPQAIEFSDGKSNIELIDGKTLAQLIRNFDYSTAKISNQYAFMEYDRFDKSKYLYFDSMISDDKETALRNKYLMLWDYVKNNDFEILKDGLINELRNTISDLQKVVYNTKSKVKKAKLMFYPFIIYLDVLEGKIEKAIENYFKQKFNFYDSGNDNYERYYNSFAKEGYPNPERFYGGMKLVLNQVGRYLQSKELQNYFGDQKDYEDCKNSSIFINNRVKFNIEINKKCIEYRKEALVFIPQGTGDSYVFFAKNSFTFMSDVEQNMWNEDKETIRKKAEKMLAMYC